MAGEWAVSAAECGCV